MADSEQSSHTPGHTYQRHVEDAKNLSILVFSYTEYFTIVKVYTKFEDFRFNSRLEICDWFYAKERKMDK